MTETQTTQKQTPLKKTPLHALHGALGAKMVPFAGYDMPVQFPAGVLKEHQHTRNAAGLFDVSHMGQAWLETTQQPLGTPEAHDAIAGAIETLVPGEIKKLKHGRLRYSALLNEAGGILDDLMITRPAMAQGDGKLFLVVNAACKDEDFAEIEAALADTAKLTRLDDRALLALQGPKAAAVVATLFAQTGTQAFMSMVPIMWGHDGEDVPLLVSRCGYTGEDGFEISVPNSHAEVLAKRLLEHPDVMPIGLGARDSLRLEAGLCLYGHDIDETTSPVEGNIAFAIGKRRREEGGFRGAPRILGELSAGPAQLRVGLKPQGRAPVREGAVVQTTQGEDIGVVTSGTFGPTAGGPVAMGYVDTAHSAEGTALTAIVRGKPVPLTVAALPFVPQNYYRG
ncbi:MAG: glycine cleavage system aminomethyltransferase GcvT [Pseudomonadota bacterium]